MRQSRFFVPVALPPGGRVILPEGAARHAVRVLRLQPGAVLTLFNGEGGEAEAVLESVGQAPVARLTALHAVSRESGLAVTLVQAIAAGDKMDWILQKAVELGVSAVLPVESARAVVRLSGGRAERRAEHWRQVAISACEQCGRNTVPRVAAVRPLHHALADLPAATLRLTLSPRGEHRLGDLPPPPGGVVLLVGPEGGLDAAELAAADAVGFSAVRLGPRILRTETAGLAALAALQTLWGDL